MAMRPPARQAMTAQWRRAQMTPPPPVYAVSRAIIVSPAHYVPGKETYISTGERAHLQRGTKTHAVAYVPIGVSTHLRAYGGVSSRPFRRTMSTLAVLLNAIRRYQTPSSASRQTTLWSIEPCQTCFV